MSDMLPNKGGLYARELGKLLEEHNGAEVVVLDMRPLNFWTDFFVIATVTSNTHLQGLERHIRDFVRKEGLEILHRSRKPEKIVELHPLDRNSGELRSDEWCLLDLGDIVVHLMTAQTRSFYELERLWSAAPHIYPSPGGGSAAYSSKSSYSTSSS